MYLTEAGLFKVVLKQYTFKLKSYLNLFYGLIVIQVLSILLSMNAVSSTSTGMGNVSFTMQKYSNDIVFVFSVIWIFCTSIIFTQNNYRNNDFAFVSNRLSSNISSILFLSTAALISSLTTIMCGAFMRDLLFFLYGSDSILRKNFYINPLNLVIGSMGGFLYMLIFCAAGYFNGILAKFSKIFIFLVPALFIAAMYMENAKNLKLKTFSTIIKFYSGESSLLIFSLKTLLTSVMLFGIGILISNRSEVR